MVRILADDEDRMNSKQLGQTEKARGVPDGRASFGILVAVGMLLDRDPVTTDRAWFTTIWQATSGFPRSRSSWAGEARRSQSRLELNLGRTLYDGPRIALTVRGDEKAYNSADLPQWASCPG